MIPLIIALSLGACIGFVAFALCRTSAESDGDYCRYCGLPTPWSDKRGPCHPQCREDAA